MSQQQMQRWLDNKLQLCLKLNYNNTLTNPIGLMLRAQQQPRSRLSVEITAVLTLFIRMLATQASLVVLSVLIAMLQTIALPPIRNNLHRRSERRAGRDVHHLHNRRRCLQASCIRLLSDFKRRDHQVSLQAEGLKQRTLSQSVLAEWMWHFCSFAGTGLSATSGKP